MKNYKRYSLLFSRQLITNLIRFNDVSDFKHIRNQNDSNTNITYLKYLSNSYRKLKKNYRCEYVLKNELLNKIISKGVNNVVFSEFKINKSILDLAVFGEKSIAYEIKTEFDSPKRLDTQLADYQTLFDKCYIVVPQSEVNNYRLHIPSTIGVLAFAYEKQNIYFKLVRKASFNKELDVDVLMQCLQTNEYIQIVEKYFGELPTSSHLKMFKACKEKIASIPRDQLRELFLDTIKKRKLSRAKLYNYPRCLSQVILSMQLTDEAVELLLKKLRVEME